MLSKIKGLLKQNQKIYRFLVSAYEKFYINYGNFLVVLLKGKDTRFSQKHPLTILSIEDTLSYSIKNHCSITRYGDAELGLAIGKKHGFQVNSQSLESRLQEVLSARNSSTCIVCLPGVLSHEEDYVPSKVAFFKRVLVRYRKKWYSYLDLSKAYGNADVSRCYMEIADKTKSETYFSLWKSIWENRNVCIVEGEFSRFGIDTDLLNNSLSVSRILCPAFNAYNIYDDIYIYIQQKVSADSVVLVALGPTATVLCSDLSNAGYWAIDVGNLDKEYEWWSSSQNIKTRNPVKYFGEVKDSGPILDCNDPLYTSSIIGRIGC